MAERFSGYQQSGGERTRRMAGAVAEYGGAALGIVELVSLNVGGALVGGVIWLIGRWARYSGRDTRTA